jgi:hypothetical protein
MEVWVVTVLQALDLVAVSLALWCTKRLRKRERRLKGVPWPGGCWLGVMWLVVLWVWVLGLGILPAFGGWGRYVFVCGITLVGFRGVGGAAVRWVSWCVVVAGLCPGWCEVRGGF